MQIKTKRTFPHAYHLIPSKKSVQKYLLKLLVHFIKYIYQLIANK